MCGTRTDGKMCIRDRYKKGSVDLSELCELYSKMDIGAAVK